MSNQILFIMLSLCAGMMIPFQSAMNAQLGKTLQSPYFSALTVFIVAAVWVAKYNCSHHQLAMNFRRTHEVWRHTKRCRINDKMVLIHNINLQLIIAKLSLRSTYYFVRNRQIIQNITNSFSCAT